MVEIIKNVIGYGLAIYLIVVSYLLMRKAIKNKYNKNNRDIK